MKELTIMKQRDELYLFSDPWKRLSTGQGAIQGLYFRWTKTQDGPNTVDL